jgi:hypothetical protein
VPKLTDKKDVSTENPLSERVFSISKADFRASKKILLFEPFPIRAGFELLRRRLARINEKPNTNQTEAR